MAIENLKFSRFMYFPDYHRADWKTENSNTGLSLYYEPVENVEMQMNHRLLMISQVGYVTEKEIKIIDRPPRDIVRKAS